MLWVLMFFNGFNVLMGSEKCLDIFMASFPQNNGGWGGMWCGRRRESAEPSRIFYGHVNFPEMNSGISVYGWAKSNNHKEEG